MRVSGEWCVLCGVRKAVFAYFVHAGKRLSAFRRSTPRSWRPQCAFASEECSDHRSRSSHDTRIAETTSTIEPRSPANHSRSTQRHFGAGPTFSLQPLQQAIMATHPAGVPAPAQNFLRSSPKNQFACKTDNYSSENISGNVNPNRSHLGTCFLPTAALSNLSSLDPPLRNLHIKKPSH